MANYPRIFLNLLFLLVLAVSCRNKGNTSDNTNNSKSETSVKTAKQQVRPGFVYESGAVIRGDTTADMIALVFTGDSFADGGDFIAETLREKNIKGSFFFTGNFYRNKMFHPLIKRLVSDGNYLGSHSDRHLLYCDWEKRDSLLVTREEFVRDLEDSYAEMKKFNIDRAGSRYFMPPYEWYNDTIASWTNRMGLVLINFSPGTRSNADYTYPEMGDRYLDSRCILKSVLDYEKFSSNGLKGFILLVHIGTDPRRTDKFYSFLPDLIGTLINRGYVFVRIDELLKN
ncbi:MAG TPA: polysaccharide deacetylase family protein [Bacteroidales bacterium]|nr:polysaccharide deacetylase family protein [Bacteroidales bacterium]